MSFLHRAVSNSANFPLWFTSLGLGIFIAAPFARINAMMRRAHILISLSVMNVPNLGIVALAHLPGLVEYVSVSNKYKKLKAYIAAFHSCVLV